MAVFALMPYFYMKTYRSVMKVENLIPSDEQNSAYVFAFNISITLPENFYKQGVLFTSNL